MQTILNYAYEQVPWQLAFVSFLLSFILSSIIAYLYEYTFQGLSYSKGFVNGMVLGSTISCLLMIAIGDNIARGIGIVGSLAIIRFRTNLRDPRDLIFLFASMGVGVAAGVRSYSTAIIGTIFFSSIVFLQHISPFAERKKHDGLIRFQIPSDVKISNQVIAVLEKFTKRFVLITMRDVAQGKAYDYSYQIKLKEISDNQQLLSELNNIQGMRGLTFTNRETTVEV